MPSRVDPLKEGTCNSTNPLQCSRSIPVRLIVGFNTFMQKKNKPKASILFDNHAYRISSVEITAAEMLQRCLSCVWSYTSSTSYDQYVSFCSWIFAHMYILNRILGFPSHPLKVQNELILTLEKLSEFRMN